jgi:hypothetical protein
MGESMARRARFWIRVEWAMIRGWFGRRLSCPRGKHHRFVMYVTDGRTNVTCRWCHVRQVPTAEELSRHPNLKKTPKQLADEAAMLEDVMNWLKEHGYHNGR